MYAVSKQVSLDQGLTASMQAAAIRVAVIGAGAAGLCAAHHLKSSSSFQFTVYEGQKEVGGTWIYTEETGRDKYGQHIHSSMYRDLRTNLPKEIMEFPDYQFTEGTSSFVHRSDVLHYLRNYAEYFQLYKFIEFNTKVKEVKPIEQENSKVLWSVKVHHLPSDTFKESFFDAVIVCSGHYSHPYIPSIPGLEQFCGLKLHSHDYRSNDIFKNMKVVVLGASSSGCDIALEISMVATEVILSHNKAHLSSRLPQNTIQRPGISSVCSHKITFLDGQTCEADAILFCTGYKYDYSFLHPNCGLTVNNQRVQPLYKHLIHIGFPTLAIIGILTVVLPFPLFNQQILFFLSVLDGTIKLPSKENMEADTKQEFENRIECGMPERHAHKMDLMQWEYIEELSSIGKLPRIKPVISKLYNYVRSRRHQNLMIYKLEKYSIVDDNNFIRENE